MSLKYRIQDQIINPPESSLNPPEYYGNGVMQDQIDAAVSKYTNADFACALVENDPINQYATEILAIVLGFASTANYIHISGATLDLREIRKMAVKSAEIQACELIEKGKL